MLPEKIVKDLNQIVARIPNGRTFYVITERETYSLVEARLSHFGAVVLHYQCRGRHGMFIVPHWQFFDRLKGLESGQPLVVHTQCKTNVALFAEHDESPISFADVRASIREARHLLHADRFLAAHPLSQLWPQLSREQISTLAWTHSPHQVANLAGVSEREVQARYARARVNPPGSCYWRRVELAYIAHPMGVAQPLQSTSAIKPARVPESAWVLHA